MGDNKKIDKSKVVIIWHQGSLIMNSVSLACNNYVSEYRHEWLWNPIFRILFNRLHFAPKRLVSFFWTVPWKDIEQAPLIICFEWVEYYLLRYIKRCFPKKRVVIWKWNMIDRLPELESQQQLACELWSFDEKECLTYSMKYNKTFMVAASVPLMKIKPEIKRDVFFVGNDKGRLKKIQTIKSQLDHLGISNYFHICTQFPKEQHNVLYSQPMTYENILYEDQQTSAILDIPLEGQYGITQREMEALFFRKKLITTNPAVKERDYYHPENIFILDLSQLPDNLVEFLQTPYISIPEDIITSYSIDSWMDRFFEE
jgi:hypothetical protein